jgi:hypothetical protein
MKKIILLLVAFTMQINFAQNTFPATGNVGIGTTNPVNSLDVNGNIQISNSLIPMGIITELGGTSSPLLNMSLNFREPNRDTHYIGGGFRIDSRGDLPLFQWLKREPNSDFEQVFMAIARDGNVGIGTTYPSSKLEVVGTIRSYEPLALGSTINSFQLINERSGNVGGNTLINRLWTRRDGALNNWYNSRLHDGISIDNDFSTPTVNTKTWWERDPLDNIQSWGTAGETYLTINAGNVGIGTTAPDAKLTVNGNIHAKEVKIDLNIPAPDYVFASDYKLKTLQEVDAYIKANSHLPEIPSAQEFEKNGLMLAEMNMSLLKKVEELTIYAIDQEKKINTQCMAMAALKKENESFKNLSERLSKLEKDIQTGK